MIKLSSSNISLAKAIHAVMSHVRGDGQSCPTKCLEGGVQGTLLESSTDSSKQCPRDF